MKEIVLALVGNQNCGKTTLFNALTGSNQHVGNFPGVTVEKKEGYLRADRSAVLVDLPGIYSLSPYTAEEIVTRDFLLDERPDAVVNVADATNLERSLYLTMQLLDLGLPTVLALNMMDEVRAAGGKIDTDALREALGIPVLPVSAVSGEGLGELAEAAARAAREKRPPAASDARLPDSPASRAVINVERRIEQKARRAGVPPRYAAVCLVEGDTQLERRLALTQQEREAVGGEARALERTEQTDREAALADWRYRRIDELCRRCVRRGGVSKENRRSVAIDRLLTGKYTALPIFFLVMLALFWLTFGPVGGSLSGLMERGVGAVTQAADRLLLRFAAAPLLRSLVIEGAFSGVGSVLSFLPTILVLFFLLSLLEDSGYMARVAFIMDAPMRRLGLSGRSFVPLLIGFGCSVPAAMASRTLPSERDRKLTVLLVPFLSCSAKLPVYAMITGLFFAGHEAAVLLCLYALGIFVGILYALFFKNTILRSDPVPFVMELPPYRMPGAKSVARLIARRAKEFVNKAFTIIFLASITIWFLQHFSFSLQQVEPAASMLAEIGRRAAPLFAPLGFTDWRATTALVTGLTAKEAVVSTLAILTAGRAGGVQTAIRGMFTFPAACAFLVFVLLYTPCAAAVAAIRRELGSGLSAVLAMLCQTGVAWLAACGVYRVMLALCGG